MSDMSTITISRCILRRGKHWPEFGKRKALISCCAVSQFKHNFPSFSLIRRMYSQEKYKYAQAIQKLNELQSNAAVVHQSIQDSNQHRKVIPLTIGFLETIGIKVEALDKLNIIHLAGTKGKGSTGAFCESILRHHGIRTGFYSSPHMVAVRERIRINGEPMSETQFADCFWEVYNLLNEVKANDKDMPSYFIFLTIMAFHVFLKEKVEAAVIEVGIGGKYDCTNIICQPVVCGVTSLGLDHVTLLGHTIDKIAWQKSGIFKKSVTAFTVRQKPEAMTVMANRAVEIECPLYIAPELHMHNWKGKPIELGLAGRIQHENAALAVQLTLAWFQKRDNTDYLSKKLESSRLKIPYGPLYIISDKVAQGLRNCVWHGRNETFKVGPITYFLDGAHTIESIQNCLEWFSTSSANERAKAKQVNCVHRILIFNSTGGRLTEKLLAPLVNCHFDLAVFCPNVISHEKDKYPDQMNYMTTTNQQLELCESNRRTWDGLQSSLENKEDTFKCESRIFPCLEDITSWLSSQYMKNPENCEQDNEAHVLVTGSLHLVGGIMSLTGPQMYSSKSDPVTCKT